MRESPPADDVTGASWPDRLTAEFFDRPVLEVAPDLLGCHLEHAGVRVRITEVEAYDGSADPGSHAYRGETARTAVMFGPPGGLYVYFTYGMHFCANLVCGPAGRAAALLVRAGAVVSGVESARTRRVAARVDRDLARGPARLAQALALGRAQNGVRPVDPDCPVGVFGRAPGEARPLVERGARVGVAGPGGDGAAFPWRFWVPGEPTVSVYRPAVHRRRR